MDGNARIWEAASGHLAAEPFAHEKQVRRVAFSPDMQRFLTGSLDGTVKLWDLTLLRPPLPVPGWLPELAEALGGKRIGDQDALATVPGETLERVRQKLARPIATNDFYASWAKWMLEERLEHPVKPFRP
jgi:WD40 repeat protein